MWDWIKWIIGCWLFFQVINFVTSDKTIADYIEDVTEIVIKIDRMLDEGKSNKAQEKEIVAEKPEIKSTPKININETETQSLENEINREVNYDELDY